MTGGYLLTPHPVPLSPSKEEREEVLEGGFAPLWLYTPLFEMDKVLICSQGV